MSSRKLKNVDYFGSYLKFKKTLKFGLFFTIPSSKFNEMTSFWIHIIESFHIEFNSLREQILSLIELKLR